MRFRCWESCYTFLSQAIRILEGRLWTSHQQPILLKYLPGESREPGDDTRNLTRAVTWWHHQMETFFRVIGYLPSVNSPHKGQWLGTLLLSLIWAWTNGCVHNRGTGDLRHIRAHYDVTVMVMAANHDCMYQKHDRFPSLWKWPLIKLFLSEAFCLRRWEISKSLTNNIICRFSQLSMQ